MIYIEPHGRGNAQYLGLGDNDILRVIAEAKRLFNVDEDRVYLTGESDGRLGHVERRRRATPTRSPPSRRCSAASTTTRR